MRLKKAAVVVHALRGVAAVLLPLACGRVSVDPEPIDGEATGGASPGEATGGAPFGGATTGGATTGGVTTGGSATGGSAAGGVATGGSTAGGIAAGGVAAGGAPSTGGAPPVESIWFPRGSLTISEDAFEKHLAHVLGKAKRPTPRSTFAYLNPGVHTLKELANQQLAEVGKSAADALNQDELLAIGGCDASFTTCSEESLSDFIRRAWHGQENAAQQAELLAALTALPVGSELGGLRDIVRRVLSSPNAYVLQQLGQRVRPGVYELDARERANLLAYGASALTEDDELVEAAESGALLEPAQLREQADRLLATPAGAEAVIEFVSRWFRLQSAEQLQSTRRDPTMQAPSTTSLVEESRRFIESVVLQQNAPVSTLLNADYTFVDASLAAFYGLPVQGAGFARADLRGTPRRGLLHHASWLTSTSSAGTPTYPARAMSVLNLLCETVPAPPAGITIEPPIPTEGQSRRQKMQAATAAPVCAGCHNVLNPLGYSFDHFDGIGRYQETENGLPIDASGYVHTFDNREFKFDSSTTLVLQIAADPGFARCYARNLAGGWVGTGAYDPVAVNYADRWDSSGQDKGLRDAILAWVSSPHFFTRAE